MMKLSMLSFVSVVAAERKQCNNTGIGMPQCKLLSDPAYSDDQKKALEECNATAACESVCTCFEEGDDQEWLLVPTPRQKCDLSGAYMALCPDYVTKDTPEAMTPPNPLDYYTKEQITALEACDVDQCCTPTCSCFVNDDDSQDWVNIPVTSECCTSLTNMSTDPSAVYYIDMDLKGATSHSHDHHGSHECPGEEVNEYYEVNPSLIDQVMISGRIGMNDHDHDHATDVCSGAKAKSWYGCKASAVCAQYEAYLQSEEDKGLGMCYAPADYNVAMPHSSSTGVDEYFDATPLLENVLDDI